MSSAEAVQVPTRVVVRGPATALEQDAAFDVVRAGSPAEIHRRPAAVPVDCLVVGLEQADGPDGLRRLRTESPSTAFVVLAEDDGDVREAIRAGAHRCLPAGDVSGPMLRVAVTEAIERRAAGLGPAAASDVTVRRLARAIELRNPETSSHIERMSCYCALLARHTGLDPDMTRIASRLHDLGKVVVPDSILLKPGALTPTERREMERHADVGRQLLQGSGVEFLDFASLIAWTHHERYDGTGVRPAEPPSEPLLLLSQRLTAGGHELAAAVAASLYKGGSPGWFATPDARRRLAALVTELRECAASGRYASAFAASDALMRRAYLQGAGLLERHSFLERFSAACQRALTLAGAPRGEIIGTRRLFAALQQAQLADRP